MEASDVAPAAGSRPASPAVDPEPASPAADAPAAGTPTADAPAAGTPAASAPALRVDSSSDEIAAYMRAFKSAAGHNRMASRTHVPPPRGIWRVLLDPMPGSIPRHEISRLHSGSAARAVSRTSAAEPVYHAATPGHNRMASRTHVPPPRGIWRVLLDPGVHSEA